MKQYNFLTARSLLVFLACLLLLSACRKASFISGKEATLHASADTLHFDTLFTSTGSVTQYFKIFNDNNQKLLISDIALQGGASSNYKINIDGFPGPSLNNIEMEAHDSLYVFVTVTIDPTTSNLPFLVEDSIRIRYNGNEQWVQLQAWGQNAHFYRSALLSGDTRWTNEKPYVIIGGLLVDEQATLTIEKGCRIYLHADAPFIVEGTLLAQGEQQDSDRIIFQGDRLDNPYRDFPAAWPGIYFRESSRNNALRHVIVKNAYQGIVAEGPSVNGNPKLKLQQCQVDNCYDAGIMGIQSAIEAENCLISNCGKNILLLYGGSYRFTHCTVAAFSNTLIAHTQPVLAVTDFIESGAQVYTAALDALFTNCIFWGQGGAIENEAVVVKKGNGPFNAGFRHCLWKVKTHPENTSSSDMIENEDPLFENTDPKKEAYNFRLQATSPAIDKGLDTGLATDLDEEPRNTGLPDLGAYEKK
ncbi:MAG: right-handed parallel beta-helix repeat-containing protein [Chitinophagaceae bacterium]|nr:right-handed parallel beta-helix repeat-containing protein [Chitinophagaceae bacterium]